MEPIFVTGHRNPDTDSIVAAMAYAALQNALGKREYIPVRLGEVNDETQLALDRFGFEAPLRITNVRTQVRDLDFDRPPVLSERLTIQAAWQVFTNDTSLSALPVVDENDKLCGMITRGDIAAYDMDALNNRRIDTVPIFNVLAALEGNLVNNPKKPIDTLSGQIVITLPRSEDNFYGLSKGCIAFVGNQPEAFKCAIDINASCIVLCQAEYTNELREMNPKMTVIYTPLEAYRAVRMLHLSLSISSILPNIRIITFAPDDYIDDVRNKVLENRYHSYPIVDKTGNVLGSLSRYHLINPRRKKVVLVDHNELSQSVPGLEQAEIVAIIDHHRLADVQTLNPVYVRNEPVGCTNTIIGTMFQENGLVPPKNLAALMATAIVSDTVSFKSPTCTQKDINMAHRLARIGDVDLDEIADAIFNASAGTERTVEELMFSDYKDFHIAGYSIGIGQVTTSDSKNILARKNELVKLMEKTAKEKSMDMMLLMITDVLKEGTALLFVGESDIIKQAFSVEPGKNEVFLEKVVSRKKQVVPALSLMWG
ncbi:MAG TPA: putative manganese-dependent inorganic diphosphatase [Clostridiales bacterium]|jgi:manganese-dependent inorganic pyrophosphatase|nr:putative manganese-dependent inorganic diphosphatase [Clostridiales bacterium]